MENDYLKPGDVCVYKFAGYRYNVEIIEIYGSFALVKENVTQEIIRTSINKLENDNNRQ